MPTRALGAWDDPSLLDEVDFDHPAFCFLCAACIPASIRDRNLGHCPACRNKGAAIVSCLMLFGSIANLWIVSALG